MTRQRGKEEIFGIREKSPVSSGRLKKGRSAAYQIKPPAPESIQPADPEDKSHRPVDHTSN